MIPLLTFSSASEAEQSNEKKVKFNQVWVGEELVSLGIIMNPIIGVHWTKLRRRRRADLLIYYSWSDRMFRVKMFSFLFGKGSSRNSQPTLKLSQRFGIGTWCRPLLGSLMECQGHSLRVWSCLRALGRKHRSRKSPWPWWSTRDDTTLTP